MWGESVGLPVGSTCLLGFLAATWLLLGSSVVKRCFLDAAGLDGSWLFQEMLKLKTGDFMETPCP